MELTFSALWQILNISLAFLIMFVIAQALKKKR